MLPFTLELTFASIIIGSAVGIPLGVLSALYRNRLLDYITRVVSLIGFSIPVFFTAILLILAFAVHFRWFPVISSGNSAGFSGRINELVLPALTGALSLMAMMTRATRSSMLEVLGEDYVRTARAKGAPPSIIVIRHALRNALIPVVTIIGLYFALIIGNSVLIETVFTRPGLGSLIIGSLQMNHWPRSADPRCFVRWSVPSITTSCHGLVSACSWFWQFWLSVHRFSRPSIRLIRAS